jgi:tRNA(fMet)-specific endonuclease VapC
VSAEVNAYRSLSRHLENYTQWEVLEFNEAAAVEFQRLRSLRLRVGTMDLKIAAIIIANSATLITRNGADFRKIPKLSFDDWTS